MQTLLSQRHYIVPTIAPLRKKVLLHTQAPTFGQATSSQLSSDEIRVIRVMKLLTVWKQATLKTTFHELAYLMTHPEFFNNPISSVPKPDILAMVNLPDAQVKKTLDALEEKGLIQCKKGRYQLTFKGKFFIRMHLSEGMPSA